MLTQTDMYPVLFNIVHVAILALSCWFCYIVRNILLVSDIAQYCQALTYFVHY